MNLPQSIVIGIAAAAIGLMTMFPPWYFASQFENSRLGNRFAGYYPIWTDNTPTDTASLSQVFSTPVDYHDLAYFSIHIDTTRLGIQIVGTLIVTLLLCTLLYSKPKVLRETVKVT